MCVCVLLVVCSAGWQLQQGRRFIEWVDSLGIWTLLDVCCLTRRKCLLIICQQQTFAVVTVTIDTTKQPQYLPKISDVSATTVAFFTKKATVVAETSLILGKYCSCFVVLVVIVMFLFNRWVYSRIICRCSCHVQTFSVVCTHAVSTQCVEYGVEMM